MLSLISKIESMNIYHQYEILKMLKKHDEVVLSENNNGTFINLTDLSDNIINELKRYIEYYNLQENDLNTIENEKQQLENTYFKNHLKDNINNIVNE